MNKKIIDFEVGDQVTGYFMVKRNEVRTSAANKKYLDIDLMDSSGFINTKLWDADELLQMMFKVGEILYIKSVVNSWRNQKQLKITEYRTINDSDNISKSDFIPSAPISPTILYDFISETINNFKDEELKTIVNAIILDKKEDFLYYPAAKANHHSIRHGLMYHIYRMLKTATALKAVYENINIDLLHAGIILHDICKINEMKTNQMGLVDDYTVEGNLLGHIAMGVELVGNYGKSLKIDRELVLLLQHMMLSHHGIPEYGSPVPPMFLEAELLNQIDVIDARVYDFEKQDSMLKAGEMSEPVFSLDRRRVYKTTYGKTKTTTPYYQ